MYCLCLIKYVAKLIFLENQIRLLRYILLHVSDIMMQLGFYYKFLSSPGQTIIYSLRSNFVKRRIIHHGPNDERPYASYSGWNPDTPKMSP